MIIVIGKAVSTPASHAEMLRISLEHVERSRSEPGCIAHNLHVDAENSAQLVFVEYWSDMAALLAHFAVPESRKFAATMTDLASAEPEIRIFEGEETRPV